MMMVGYNDTQVSKLGAYGPPCFLFGLILKIRLIFIFSSRNLMAYFQDTVFAPFTALCA